ncbi:hypothetical protein SAMN05216379_10446 [Nitrosomonas eutropha]|nr:hypothetical protein SAMN05216379_10446 [Nitrosomonas eutropha]
MPGLCKNPLIICLPLSRNIKHPASAGHFLSENFTITYIIPLYFQKNDYQSNS